MVFLEIEIIEIWVNLVVWTTQKFESILNKLSHYREYPKKISIVFQLTRMHWSVNLQCKIF